MAAARAGPICGLVPAATAPAMGIAVTQRAAMVVASPSLVVPLADRFGFGANMVASPVAK
jgi:hypothetical protein